MLFASTTQAGALLAAAVFRRLSDGHVQAQCASSPATRDLEAYVFNVGARILGIRLPRGRLYEMPTVCWRHFDVVVAVGEQPDAWPWPTIVRIDGMSVGPAQSFDVEQVALDNLRNEHEPLPLVSGLSAGGRYS